MNKNWKYKPDDSFWIGVFLLCLSLMVLFYGRKERVIHQKLEEKIEKEQVIPVEPEKHEEAEKTEVTEVPKIRVVLMNQEDHSYVHSHVVLQSTDGLQITGAAERSCPADTTVELRELLPADGTVFVKGSRSDAKISVLSMKRSQGIPAYEGTLEITRKGEGFCIINEVDLETYLKYVVPSEMPADYPAEALKAQAVCARTYAVKQMQEGRLAEYGADVDDSVSSQVYNNIGRQAASDQAVEETSNLLMACGGEVIQAYFFSTSCGYTSTDEVWGTDSPSPYLKSVSVSGKTVEALASGNPSYVPEKFSEETFRNYILEGHEQDYEKEEAWYRWKVILPLPLLQERILEKNPGIGQIREITVRSRSSGGTAMELLIRGTQGEETIREEYAIREFLSTENLEICCHNGQKNSSMKLLPSACFVVEPVKEGEHLTGFCIRGGGYGHGVGMSQNGAKHLASDGLEWKEILEIFYQNIEFIKQR